jgi:hypothetical protein
MRKHLNHLYALFGMSILHVVIFAKLIFFTPERVPYAVIPFDFASAYSRWLVYISDSFHAGILPLWVPYVAGGSPFFINPQSQLFSPVTLLVGSLVGYSQYTAQLQVVMTLLFGGIGAYLLAYVLWRSYWSALVTGICFSSTSALFTNLEHMTSINTLTLMPWLFWVTTIASRSKSRWTFPLLAFLIYFVITSGYPGVIAMILLWLSIYTLYLLYLRADKNRLKVGASFLCAWLLGLGLSAVHWLPVLIHRKEFTRGTALSLEEGTFGSLPFKYLWGMLFQFMPVAPLSTNDVDISMRGLYFGALALPLILVALFYVKDKIVTPLLVLSVGAFLMACGNMFFGRVALHILFPIMNFSRFPAIDSRGPMVLGLVLLAGGGARLLSQNSEQGRTLMSRTCISLVALLLVGLIVLRNVLDAPVYNEVAVNYITADVFFILLALIALRMFSGRMLMVSVCALLALELGTCVLANFPIIGSRVTAEQYREFRASHQSTFNPDAANRPRIVAGNGLVDEEAGRAYAEKTFYLSDYNPVRLVRFDRLISNGFTEWLATGKRVVALPPGSQPDSYDTFQNQSRPVDYTILSYTPNQVRYLIRADQDSLLVFNEVFFPGWRANIDGETKSVSEICGGLRSLNVAAGSHLVVMTFKPNSFYWGLAISITSIAIFIVWSGLLLRHSRRLAREQDRKPLSVKNEQQAALV